MLQKLSANIESAMCKSIFASFCLFFSTVFIFIGLILLIANLGSLPIQIAAVSVILTIVFSRAIYAVIKGE